MLDTSELKGSPRALVKVWCDGCYDLMHFGHANSLRQAKALGDYLIVGVHSDEEITRHKGRPVYTFEERCQLVAGIRWVDEVIAGAPYVTDLDTLQRHNCTFCCHGDDITLTEAGKDTYSKIKQLGKYKEVKRTRGISTTGLVNRILSQRSEITSPWTGGNRFLLTAGRIVQFFGGSSPEPDDVIVYVMGGFDVFHVGHLLFLEKARALGDYLIVGLYSDRVISEHKGSNYPIMSIDERLLNLLACKYVSEVVIDAPFEVTGDLMDAFKIDVVAGGVEDKTISTDPYKYPKDLNKFVRIDSGSDVTTEGIIERIFTNKFEYMQRNEKKERREVDLINAIQSKLKMQEID